jgi:hypothetical protein
MVAVLKNPRFLAIAAVTFGLSCEPMTVCGCTPSQVHATIYGEAPGAGTANAWDMARVDIAGLTPCPAEPSWAFSEQFAVPASGAYSRIIDSSFRAGDHCVRVTFFESTPGASDSVRAGPLVVSFSRVWPPNDSTLIVLPP